jgi:hypothetical protein
VLLHPKKRGRRASKSCALSNQISSIMTPNRKKPAGPPMDLGNMRQLGVRALAVHWHS